LTAGTGRPIAAGDVTSLVGVRRGETLYDLVHAALERRVARAAQLVEPVLERYRPEALIGASGQDASAFDANGRMNVSMDGFHAIGRSMRECAERSRARLLLVQEGGYARTYAAYCLHATLEGVLGTGRLLADPIAYMPDDASHANEDIDSVCTEHGRWGLR